MRPLLQSHTAAVHIPLSPQSVRAPSLMVRSAVCCNIRQGSRRVVTYEIGSSLDKPRKPGRADCARQL
jgi:hypothetical protein